MATSGLRGPILRTWGIKYYLADPAEEGPIRAALQEAWDISGPVAVLLPEPEGAQP